MADDKASRVIEAAKRVFVQYGYRRVTMGDIAAAAELSRPALYLVYPSKAEIFTAALDDVLTKSLDEVRAAVERDLTLEHRLRVAFDIWCVRPFEMVLASPDAKDLFESGQAFARDLVESRFAAFEQLIAHQLAPLFRARTQVPGRPRLTAIQIAHLMVGAALGFKQQAKDAAQLRQLIAGQIAIVLASLR
jgi:AcrR family transcriptional regulator